MTPGSINVTTRESPREPITRLLQNGATLALERSSKPRTIPKVSNISGLGSKRSTDAQGPGKSA